MVAMGRSRGGDRRSPGGQNRVNVLSVRLSDSELADVRAAAERAGMATSAWAGELAVDAARHKTLPVGWLHREVITELVRIRGQVKMAGRNVNQAVARLNATGAADGDLRSAVGYLLKVAERIDQAAEQTRRRM
jgi:hypothetical protein